MDIKDKDWDSFNKLATNFFEDISDIMANKIDGLEVVVRKYDHLGLPEYMSKVLTMMAVKVFYETFAKHLEPELELIKQFDKFFEERFGRKVGEPRTTNDKPEPFNQSF